MSSPNGARGAGVLIALTPARKFYLFSLVSFLFLLLITSLIFKDIWLGLIVPSISLGLVSLSRFGSRHRRK